MDLCSQCSELLKQGGFKDNTNPSLLVISTGDGTVGGRTIKSTVLRCPLCNAMWQRETDVRTLKEMWYLKAGTA
jgi:hypothetical protein